MKRFIAIAALAFTASFAGHAQAIGSAADMVGAWGFEKGCHLGVYSYVLREGRFTQVVVDHGKTYESEIDVVVSGDVLKIIDDEKMFTYRITGPDSVEFLRLTNLENGLSTRTQPKTWHRCN